MNAKKGEINREFRELGLSALPSRAKESGYRVPEGYFESFSSTVRERIATEEKNIFHPGAKMLRMRTIVSMAASFLLLVALGISILLLRNGKEEGYLADDEGFIYDDYFARASEMDRTLFFDLILTQEDLESANYFQPSEYEDDYLLDYLLDAAPYNGIEPMELITQPEIEYQR